MFKSFKAYFIIHHHIKRPSTCTLYKINTKIKTLHLNYGKFSLKFLFFWQHTNGMLNIEDREKYKWKLTSN